MQSELVGRRAELELLMHVATEETSSFKVVDVVGGAGMGKSRLISELIQTLWRRRLPVSIYQTYAKPSARRLEPIQALLRARFGLSESIEDDDGPERVRHVIERVVGDHRVSEISHLITTWLGLNTQPTPLSAILADNASYWTGILVEVLRDFLIKDTEGARGVFIIDDFHLAHGDTVEFLRQLLDGIVAGRILFVFVGRSDMLHKSPWASTDDALELQVGPLPPSETRSLAQALLKPFGDPPEDLVHAAVRMSSGNPFLLEQAVRCFVDSGVLERRDQRWVIHLAKLEAVSVPLSFSQAVSQRISSLAPSDRALLEGVSFTDGTFWFGMLLSVSRMGIEEVPQLWSGHRTNVARVRDAVSRLEQLGFLEQCHETTVPGELEYRFVHSAEVEALARGVSPQRSRQVHRTLAQWLATHPSGDRELWARRVAHHTERADGPAESARYHALAGEFAERRFAVEEAVADYECALGLVGDGEPELRLEWYHRMGSAQHHLGRSREAIKTFGHMLQLAFLVDLKGKGGAAHNRLGRIHRDLGELDDAMRHLRAGQALFDAAQDTPGVASSLDDMGVVYWMLGDLETAKQFIASALAQRTELGHTRSIAVSYHNLGRIHERRWEVDDACECLERAVQLRTEAEDMPGRVASLLALGNLCRRANRGHQAERALREALLLATRARDPRLLAHVHLGLARLTAALSDRAESTNHLDRAQEIALRLPDASLELDLWTTRAQFALNDEDLEVTGAHMDRAFRWRDRTPVSLATIRLHRTHARWLWRRLPVQSGGRERQLREVSDSFERAQSEATQLSDHHIWMQVTELWIDFLEMFRAEVDGAEEQIAALRSSES